MFHHDHMRWARRLAEDGARIFAHRPPGDEGHGRRGGGRHRGDDRDGGSRSREGRDRESRLFDHGDLRLVIMGLLLEAPRYGYDIIKVLEERIGGGYSPSPGVVYPTLTLLEELGQAAISEERAGRKLYTLTPEGRAFIEAQRTTLDAILARIEKSAPTRRGPPPQVVRALENLGSAVRLRLKGQAATEAQILAVAAAIDAAAKSVEEI